MNQKTYFILSVVLDCVLISCSAFSTLSTVFKFYFMINVERMASAPYFVTFTGLSNVFIGVAAILCLVCRLINKSNKLPILVFLIKVRYR